MRILETGRGLDYRGIEHWQGGVNPMGTGLLTICADAKWGVTEFATRFDNLNQSPSSSCLLS